MGLALGMGMDLFLKFYNSNYYTKINEKKKVTHFMSCDMAAMCWWSSLFIVVKYMIYIPKYNI